VLQGWNHCLGRLAGTCAVLGWPDGHSPGDLFQSHCRYSLGGRALSKRPSCIRILGPGLTLSLFLQRGDSVYAAGVDNQIVQFRLLKETVSENVLLLEKKKKTEITTLFIHTIYSGQVVPV